MLAVSTGNPGKYNSFQSRIPVMKDGVKTVITEIRGFPLLAFMSFFHLYNFYHLIPIFTMLM